MDSAQSSLPTVLPAFDSVPSLDAPKRTAASIAADNHHVAALPAFMLKDPAKEISTADIQTHSAALGLLVYGHSCLYRAGTS